MEQIKIKSGYRIPTDEEFIRWSDDAAALVQKYKWENKTVRPWSYPIEIIRLISDIRTAPQCTYGSKVELYLLAEGLTRILNRWEDTELNGVTLKNLKTGETFKIDKELADEMVQDLPERFEVVK
jgi:hypothetical protein